MSISSKNNDHLQRTANNCLNSILCVPFSDKNITSRKLGDEDLHKMTKTEGKGSDSLHAKVLKIPMILNFLKCYFPIGMLEGDVREEGKIIRPYFSLSKTNAKLYGKNDMSDYEEKKSDQKNKGLKTEAYTNLRTRFRNFSYFTVLLIV